MAHRFAIVVATLVAASLIVSSTAQAGFTCTDTDEQVNIPCGGAGTECMLSVNAGSNRTAWCTGGTSCSLPTGGNAMTDSKKCEAPVIDPTDPVVKPLAEQYDKACTAATDCLVQGPISLTCDSTDDKCKVVRGSMLGGDPCSRDEDCNSAKCEANRCKGIADGETCTLSAQCMSTSYCKASNNKCVEKLDTGKECNSYWDCKTGLCANTKCTAFGSIAAGEDAVITGGGYSPAVACTSSVAEGATCIVHPDDWIVDREGESCVSEGPLFGYTCACDEGSTTTGKYELTLQIEKNERVAELAKTQAACFQENMCHRGTVCAQMLCATADHELACRNIEWSIEAAEGQFHECRLDDFGEQNECDDQYLCQDWAAGAIDCQGMYSPFPVVLVLIILVIVIILIIVAIILCCCCCCKKKSKVVNAKPNPNTANP